MARKTYTLEFPMKRVGHTLVLTSPAFIEDFEKIKENTELMVPRPKRVTEFRLKQSAYFHAVMTEVLKGGVWQGDIKSLKRQIKMRYGFGTLYPVTDGTAMFIPDSTSPYEMEDHIFDDFIQRTQDFLVERLEMDADIVHEMFNRHRNEAGLPPPKNRGEELKAPVNTFENEDSLENRLTAFGASIDGCNSALAFGKRWAEVWEQEATKALHREAAGAMEKIVVASRLLASGKLTRPDFTKRFDEAITGAIAPLIGARKDMT